MHKIEQALYSYIEEVGEGKQELSEELITEFGERCKSALRKHVSELKQKEFRLRMSNIGRDLRSLMLDKKYGYGKASPDFILKMLYGSLYEALTLLLLKASKINLEYQDKPITLNLLGNGAIDGELDVCIDGKIYDVKTASPFAYDSKFKSWEDLAYSDDFGYMAQGFGYAVADDKKFGGWIVINKATGAVKVVPIPDDVHDGLRDKYIKEIQYKYDYVNADKVMPECTGVVEETYYKKPSGNKILSSKCAYCSHKQKCHPDIKYLPSKVGKSDNPKYVWYTEVKDE